MANPHKGEVEFRAGEDSYTLSFSADALAELEDALGKTVNEISAAMQNPATFRINMVRTVFWAGLLDHHNLDMPAVRSVFKQIKVTQAVDLIGRAFTLAFPDVAKDAAAAPVDPPKPGAPAADGTGSAS